MAVTEVAGRANASGASGSAVAGAVARFAALVATNYGRSVQGSRFSRQLAADGLCRLDENPSPCPLVAGARCATKLECWRGLPVPQAGGQRKVVLAREVRCSSTPCSSSRYSCTLEAMNTKAATRLPATIVSAWKRCDPPSPATPNPSIERTHNGGAQCLASSRVVPPLCAAHVKR